MCFHILFYITMVGTHNLKHRVGSLTWRHQQWKGGTEYLSSRCVSGWSHTRKRIKNETWFVFSFALFKLCVDHTKVFFCSNVNFQLIEEIMRAVSSHTQSDFCVIVAEDMIPVLVSRIVCQTLYMYMKSHPLLESYEFQDLMCGIRYM